MVLQGTWIIRWIAQKHQFYRFFGEDFAAKSIFEFLSNYYIISYHTIPYHIILYYIIPYYIMFYSILFYYGHLDKSSFQ